MMKKVMRALIVDDEAGIRRLICRAMRLNGFECDEAADGEEAKSCLLSARYDAVITDLRMPNKHGHWLATEILAKEDRPVVVVYTSVIEPRLAKDLIAKGVDDIVFKPTNLSVLAAKVESLLQRKLEWQTTNGEAAEVDVPAPPKENQEASDTPNPIAPISISQLQSRLDGLTTILPISQAALDVYSMTSTNNWETWQIAAAIQRDPSLTTEVLRLANSSFYNFSGQEIFDLQQAVVQIGQNRVGELALAINSLSALTSNVLPWLDVTLSWKQSMAAGLAMELLLDEGKHQAIEQGLLLCAIMHPLGRVILGTLYPHQYETMIQHCEQSGESLQDLERITFPLSDAKITAQSLARWNVPATVHLPLEFATDDYYSLRRVSEPTRIRAELVKMAIFIGRLAIGRWEFWDRVEIPPDAILRRLRLESLTHLVAQTSEGVELLSAFRMNRSHAVKTTPVAPSNRQLNYCNLSGSAIDMVEMLVKSMGIRLVGVSEDALQDFVGPVLVNCLGVPPHRLAARVRRTSKQELLILADADRGAKYQEYGQAIGLPSSYGRLRDACDRFSYGPTDRTPQNLPPVTI